MIVGIVFVVSGNYLPKSRQNYTIGIKLPWTLADVDNWNKTHRLAGALWIAAGIFVLVRPFLPIRTGLWFFFCTGGHGLPAGALLVYFVCEKGESIKVSKTEFDGQLLIVIFSIDGTTHFFRQDFCDCKTKAGAFPTSFNGKKRSKRRAAVTGERFAAVFVKAISQVSLMVTVRSPSLYFTALLIRLAKIRERALASKCRSTFFSGSVMTGVMPLSVSAL